MISFRGNLLHLLMSGPPQGPVFFLQALLNPEIKLGNDHERLIHVVAGMIQKPHIPVDWRNLLPDLEKTACDALRKGNPKPAQDFLIRGATALATALHTGLSIEDYNKSLAEALLHFPNDGTSPDDPILIPDTVLNTDPENLLVRNNAQKILLDREFFNTNLDQLLASDSDELTDAVDSMRYNIHMALDADARFLTPDLVEKILEFAKKYALLDVFKRCFSNAGRLGLSLVKPDDLKTKDEVQMAFVVANVHALVMDLMECKRHSSESSIAKTNHSETAKQMHSLLTVILWDGLRLQGYRNTSAALTYLININGIASYQTADDMARFLDNYIEWLKSNWTDTPKIMSEFKKTRWCLLHCMLFGCISDFESRSNHSLAVKDYEFMSHITTTGSQHWWDQVPQEHFYTIPEFHGKPVHRHPDIFLYCLGLITTALDMAADNKENYRSCCHELVERYLKDFPGQRHTNIFSPDGNTDPCIPRRMAFKLLMYCNSNNRSTYQSGRI